MSLKAKLVSTIAAICMVICLLSVGIWAASAAVVNISGSVSFDATDVYVQVDGAVSGAADNSWTDTVTFNTQSAADTDTNEDETPDAASDDFVIPALSFAQKSDGTLEKITITLTITNLSTERKLNVAIGDNTAEAGDTSVTIETAVTDAQVAAGGDKTTTATITISTTKTADQAVGSTSFAVVLSLTNGGK